MNSLREVFLLPRSCVFLVILILLTGGLNARAQGRDASRVKQEPSGIETPVSYSYAKLRPTGLFDAEISGGYLKPYIDASVEKGVLDYLEKFEVHGFVENFRIVGKKLEKKHAGGANNNEFVYKLAEAAGYYAPRSAAIRETFGKLNADILAAQADDGYLNTFYDNPLLKKRKPDNRFQPMNRFEFYDFGHFAQAAVAWFRATGDREMLGGAIRFADLICDRFSAPKLLPYVRNRNNRPNLKYEHPNHEMAMVELYRVTGDRRYLDFAAHTLDQYGFWEFEEVWGHAVQETLLLCGGTDVYLETGRREMLEQLERMWRDVHERKMYITGGIGSKGYGESFGAAWELPNAGSYAETCAAISLVFWNHRMLLATGEAKYAEAMERALYNATLVGISLTGTEYFYVNRMEMRKPPANREKGTGLRNPWFGTSCCPPNVHRLFGSLQQYLYTTDDSGVQVHLYNDSKLDIRLKNGSVAQIEQRTDYPLSGKIEIAMNSGDRFTLSLRIPAWAKGAKVRRNSKPVEGVRPGGYARIDRKWRKGDVVELDFPMKARTVEGNPKVEDQVGKVALMRGPLVYCLEGADHPGTDVFDLSIPAGAKISESRDDILGGVVQLKGEARDRDGKPARFIAVPYNVWANREISAMRIWIPVAN